MAIILSNFYRFFPGFMGRFAVKWLLKIPPRDESALCNHVLACNFAKYLADFNFFTDRLSNKRINNSTTP